VRAYVPDDSIDEQWDLEGLDRELESGIGLSINVKGWVEQQAEVDAHGIHAHVRDAVNELFRAKEEQIGAETMRQLEKHIMLTVVDNAWKDHLANMDYLRQGIYLVGYAQQDPKQAFKRESFKLFSEMLERIKSEVTQMLARIRIRSEQEVAEMEAEQRRLADRLQKQMQASGGGAPPAGAFGGEVAAPAGERTRPPQMPLQHDGPKVGRNEPCPCGSGKKYKHCHGQLA
jgi:preprotein translocase subunit SecA